jgi:hypothetical protein
MSAELHIWKARLGECDLVFHADTEDLLEATKLCLKLLERDNSPKGLSLEYIGRFCDAQPVLRPSEIGELCQEFDWVHGQHNDPEWAGLTMWQWIAHRVDINAFDADTYLKELYDTRRRICPRCRAPKPEQHRCAKHGCQCLHCNTEASECPNPSPRSST